MTPEPPEDTLWAFEYADKYIYVTDVCWRAGDVVYTTIGPQELRIRKDETMSVHQFKRFARKDNVYQIPI